MYFLFIVLIVVADDDDNDDDDDDDSSIPCLVSLSLLFYLFPIQAWAVRDAYVYVLLCKLCWQDLILLLLRGDGDASVLSFLLPIQAVALKCTSTMCMLVVVAIFFFTMRHFVIEMLLIYHQHI